MEHSVARQLASRARLIDEIESTMQALNIASSYFRYKREEYFPKFVHVLRINPEKLDPVSSTKLVLIDTRDMLVIVELIQIPQIIPGRWRRTNCPVNLEGALLRNFGIGPG